MTLSVATGSLRAESEALLTPEGAQAPSAAFSSLPPKGVGACRVCGVAVACRPVLSHSG
jgi:hypothetical protein